MSLEKIIDQIQAEAKQKTEQIMKEAKDKAEEIKKEFIEEAGKKKAIIIEEAKKDAQDREKRMLQMAQLSGRKTILAEKQNTLHTFFSDVMDRLAGLNPDKYRKLMKHMLLKAVKSGNEEIILSSKDRNLLDKAWLDSVNKALNSERNLPGRLQFAQETRDITGGFILRNGQVEINSSFEALLKFNQNALESEDADFLHLKRS
ncbi:MAG: V-type ATP synthase subunit E [bacterium]